MDLMTLAMAKKMGGGSWNDLTDKPFGETQAFEPITWDGDMSGHKPIDTSMMGYVGTYLVKVSDQVLTKEELIGATVIFGSGQRTELNEERILDDYLPGGIAIQVDLSEGLNEISVVYSADELNAAFGGENIFENGVYFATTPADNFYVASLFAPETIKPLDAKYLPPLVSPNGTKYAITVSDDGTLSAKVTE